MRSFSDTLSSFKPLLSGRLPGQLVIQYSNRCNADCPQCSMRRSNNMVRSTLPLARAKALIDDAARQGVKSLSLTGGEPLMFVDEVVELIHHATGAGIPFVRTGTNGFIFARPESPDFSDRVSRLVEKLAATKL